MSDMKIELEHILLLVIGAFILYHFMSRGCGCNNGFRVGCQSQKYKVGAKERELALREAVAVRRPVGPKKIPKKIYKKSKRGK